MLSNTLVYYTQKEDSLLLWFEKCLNEGVSEEFFYNFLSDLLKLSISHGFYGNLWHCLIAREIVSNENAYSLSCEMTGDVGGSISKTALLDFEKLYELFNTDIAILGRRFQYDYDTLKNFDAKNNEGYIFSERIRNTIIELTQNLEKASNATEFMQTAADFYKSYGVGELGLHKAFRIVDGRAKSVAGIAHINLSDLIGYDYQKKQLTDNTEAFLAGKRANNCLLYGDAGTGKSTSIKAIANEYYKDGLRLIEVYKHQLKDIHKVISQIKSRKYKFILYMDDLSFEEFETEYKYLKAVIEGGLEKKPDNVLIYATSNRRHLIRENFSDKGDILSDDIHKNDTVQEKLSLSYRFGVNIYYGKPEKKEFNSMILELKKRNNISMSDEEIILEANKWEMSHGGISGRTAAQFIDYIVGTLEK